MKAKDVVGNHVRTRGLWWRDPKRLDSSKATLGLFYMALWMAWVVDALFIGDPVRQGRLLFVSTLLWVGFLLLHTQHFVVCHRDNPRLRQILWVWVIPALWVYVWSIGVLALHLIVLGAHIPLRILFERG